jgi:outer membrane protein OmpA-like peptidoglycan-associated protein
MQTVFNFKMYILGFLFFFNSIVFCNAQVSVYKGRGAIAEITMPSPALTVGHFDLFLESRPTLKELDNNSYWYKLVFKRTCDFEITLFPLVESDHYMYRIFKVENNRFICEAKTDQTILPINDIKKTVTYTDHDQTESFRANLVFTNKVQVKRDDAVYIVIESLWGTDQGHIMGIRTCDSSFVFEAIKSRIASDTLASIKTVKEELKDEYAIAAVCNKFCPPVENYLTVDNSVNLDRTLEASIAKKTDFSSQLMNLHDSALKAGDSLILNNILFYPNTPVIKDESVAALDKLADFMKNNRSAVISIEGHTNTNHFIHKETDREKKGGKWAFHGTAKQLSMDRASEVKEYLVSSGIESGRIQCVGWGGTRKLIDHPKTAEESFRNMRVQIVILKI